MVRKINKYSYLIGTFLFGTLLFGCSSLKPYRMDINQGNELSEEEVDKLSEGMTEEQVLFVLGTPILQDVFHKNRWDYVYYLKPGYKQPFTHYLSVYFENGKVSHFIRNNPA